MLSETTALKTPGTDGIALPLVETDGHLLAVPTLAADRPFARRAITGGLLLVLGLGLGWPGLLLVAALTLPILAWLAISGMKIVEKDLQYY